MPYGFGEFESYAYSAETNHYNYLRLTNINANATDVNACINEPLAVKVVLPAKANKLIWCFEDPGLSSTELNPLCDLKIAVIYKWKP